MILKGMPAFLSISEVAFLYGLKRHVVENMVERGGLPSVQLSGRRGKRFIPSEDAINRYPGSRASIELRLAQVQHWDADVDDDAA